MERVDLINQLLDHNAPLDRVITGDIIGTMDVALIERFLALRMDFANEDGFYYALNNKRARPLLGIYRKFRKDYPILEDQIARALVAAARDKKLKWAILADLGSGRPNPPCAR